MDWDRRRADDRRGGESYRPADRPGRSPSRGYDIRRRSPPRNRSRPRADTWVPSNRGYGRPRSRSPPDYRRRSRTPPFQGRAYGPGVYNRRRSPPRRFSPRRDDRFRSPPPSWRSRSPYSEGKSRDASRGRSNPRRTRDSTPGNQESRMIRRSPPIIPSNDRSARPPSPRVHPMPPVRCQSPHAGRRDQLADTRERPRSRSRPGSPTYLTVTEPSVISRRSSPAGYPEQGGPAPFRSRSRSPAHHSPSRRSSYCDIRPDPEISETGKVPEDLDRPVEKDSIEHTKLAVNIPIQPRNLALRQSPPSGPSQGPKLAPTPNRGSQNLSLLSAPTRPRRGPASREGTWVGAPGARRGPPSTVPSGPRASFAAPAPGGGSYRHSTSRPGGSTPILSSAPKGPTHMTGLGSIIPGGRTLPSMLDAATERRLAQLEVDRERLLDQVLETQRSKRAGLRDWDRLDRESSICALKSELAEGHLQRMADESIRGGVLF